MQENRPLTLTPRQRFFMLKERMVRALVMGRNMRSKDSSHHTRAAIQSQAWDVVDSHFKRAEEEFFEEMTDGDANDMEARLAELTTLFRQLMAEDYKKAEVTVEGDVAEANAADEDAADSSPRVRRPRKSLRDLYID